MLTFNNFSLQSTQHFINGKWEPSVLGNSYTNLNPANGSIIGHAAEGSAVEISLAAKVAHLCHHKEWRTVDASKRNFILFKTGELIANHTDFLASIETMESGRPIRDTLAEIQTAAEIFKNHIHTPLVNMGTLEPLNHNYRVLRIAPYGVVGIITDSAGSFLSAAIKVVSALGSGNTVVLKPSKYTPCAVTVMATICKEAGLPDGAFNVVIGGTKSGAALLSNPLIDKIVISCNPFISSCNVDCCTEKNCYLERYETVAHIVFKDADLDVASDAIVQSLILNMGNISKSKITTFVDKKVYNALIDRLSEKVTKIIVGDPQCPETQVGPLVSKTDLDRLVAKIETSRKKGADLVTGGRFLKGHGNPGFYYQPTLLVNNTNSSLISSNVFGPFMEVNHFYNYKDLLMSLRNFGNIKGLSLWTKDHESVDTMGTYINPRYIWINKYLDNDPLLVLEETKEKMFKQASIFPSF